MLPILVYPAATDRDDPIFHLVEGESLGSDDALQVEIGEHFYRFHEHLMNTLLSRLLSQFLAANP